MVVFLLLFLHLRQRKCSDVPRDGCYDLHFQSLLCFSRSVTCLEISKSLWSVLIKALKNSNIEIPRVSLLSEKIHFLYWRFNCLPPHVVICLLFLLHRPVQTAVFNNFFPLIMIFTQCVWYIEITTNHAFFKHETIHFPTIFLVTDVGFKSIFLQG